MNDFLSELLVRCKSSPSKVIPVLKTLTLEELEKFHSNYIGEISDSIKSNDLYFPTLFRRCARFLERMVRVNNGEDLSPQFLERNSLWLSPPIENVVLNPPKDSLGLSWNKTALLSYCSSSKRQSVKKEKKGVRGKVLDILKQKKTASVHEIFNLLKDPDVNPHYVKVILYSAKKQGLVDTIGKGVFVFKGGKDEN